MPHEVLTEVLKPVDYKEFVDWYNKTFALTPKLQDASFIVLKVDGQIVGCLGLYRPVVIDSMGIDKEYRNKGYWKLLIESIPKLWEWPVGSGVHFFASTPREIALAKKFGCDNLLSLIYRKLF